MLNRDDPLAGSLAPQSVVRHAGKEGRFDDLFGWGFQLIGWRCDPAEHLGADELRFLERIGTVIVGLSEENDVTGAYAEFFHAHEISGLLARPDFAVFGVVRRIDQFAALVSSIGAARSSSATLVIDNGFSRPSTRVVSAMILPDVLCDHRKAERIGLQERPFATLHTRDLVPRRRVRRHSLDGACDLLNRITYQQE